MKYALLGLTALCSVVCLTMAPRAEARSIRADTNPSNGWNACTTINPCASLPTGLTFNPFGSDPTAAPSPTLTGGLSLLVPDAQGGPDAQTPCISSGCGATGWSTPVPGVALAYTSGATQAQVVLFNLSNNPLETVYGPALDSLGNPIPLGSASGTAWEIGFNYSSTPTTSASLAFGGNIYTASAQTLSPANLNEFVYFNGALYAPTGWTETSATVSAPEIDPSAAIAALTLLAGCLAVLGGGRRTPIASR
jgi:hypothetical protein